MARRELKVGNISGVSGEVNVAGGDIYKGYTVEQVSALLAEITSKFQRKPFDGRCPYKGLDFFEEEDAEFFFGRERLVEDLLSRVRESRTVFITGPSGSGKSSLVRAGLIHALKQGALKERQSEHWLYETMKPGREPLKDLALAFSRLKSPELADYFQAHSNETDVLNKCAESVLSGQKDQRFILFIDQFEEVFTQISQEEERLAFLTMLAHAGTVENGRVIVLFAMRSDFVSNCATYPAVNELLSQQFRQIGAMQPEELVSAIALPARHVGLPVEDELIARIINDMKGEPGALPLMQFALKDLFDAQQAQGGVIALTLEDYLRHGGIHKSLERHADHSFSKLSEGEQHLARSIFSGLIEIGRGTSDTRRTALFDELVPADAKPAEVEAIVRKLADARLIITDEQAGRDTVTISHEKLIDAWPWLKKLVNENRDVIALQNEIAGDAKEWDDQVRDPSYLYTGARLANAREKLEANKIVLSGLAQQFIETGVKSHADELEAATQRAAQLRRRSVYLSAALGLALVAVAVAIYFSVQSRREAKLSSARELAAVSISALNFDSELALHLAMQSVTNTHTLQGEDALRRALLVPPVRLTLVGHSAAVYSVAYDPEGKRLVTASEDGTARIWDAQTGSELIVLRGHTGAVNDAAFSRDGQLVATAGEDATVRLWDPTTGETLQTLQKHTAAVNSVAFSPDGTSIVTASDDTTVRLWQVADGAELHVFTDLTRQVRSAQFSPDGERIAAGGYDQDTIIWDAASGEWITSIYNDGEGVSALAFSPDSRSLLVSWGSQVRRWDIDAYELTTTYSGQQSWYVTSVGFNPVDGGQVVTASRDQSVYLWDTNSGKPLAALRGHGDAVYDVAFAPDGNRVATASANQTVRIWDIAEWRKRTLIGHSGPIYDAAYSFDGRRIATVSQDGTIRIWDAQSGRELLAWPYPDFYAHKVAFSPDDKLLATTSDDGTWRLWEVATGEELGKVQDTYIVHDARFSPDGTRIITTGRNNLAIIWDAETRQPLKQLEGHTDWISTGLFDPTGELALTTSADGTARIWDVGTGKPLHVLVGHSELVTGGSFSPDSKRVVTSSVDGTARVWETETGRPLLVLKGHLGQVSEAEFSQDNRWIATGGGDRTARIWDAETGEELIQLVGHTDGIYNIAFSPDSRYLLTASLDGTARIYPLSFEDVLAVARPALSPRELTCAERVEYFHEQIPCPTATPAPVNNTVSTEPAAVQRTIADVIREETDAGRWEQSLHLLEEARDNRTPLDGLLDDSEFLNSLCWGASVDGFADRALAYCELAVAMAPDDPGVRDSRGVARALTGDYPGAVEDFQFFVDHYEFDEALVEQRRGWILDLNAGIDPFSPDLLIQLQEQ